MHGKICFFITAHFSTHLCCYFPKSLQLLNYANQVTIIFCAKMFYLIAVINLFL